MSRNAQLFAELVSYQAADELDARHYAAFLELLSDPTDAFERTRFGPGHITASLFIIDEPAHALLLHHHRRLNRWLQMGGHVEEGESTVVAALREGREESGLGDLQLITGAILDLDVHPIPAGKGEPDHFHFDVRYLACTLDPSGIAMDHKESNQLAWIPLDEAEALMNEAASSRVIRKIRSRA